MGSDDQSYNCIFQQEDSEGIRGVKLDRVSCSPSLGNHTAHTCEVHQRLLGNQQLLARLLHQG